MKKGLFITFEGIDGCGKSTQFEMLRDLLEEKGVEYIVVREPGGTSIGEKIREILLSKKSDGMVPMAELFLFEAARAQIVEEKIRPALLSGITVLCDRFMDSTVAYQGVARDLGLEVTDSLNRLATGDTVPDVTFLINVPVDVALRRRRDRGDDEDRLEALGTSFQEKVAEGYLKAASRDTRIRVIDGVRTPEEIFADIRKIVEELK